MTVLHPITMVIGPCTAVLSHKALATTVCRVQTPHSTLEGGTAVWRLPNTTRTLVRRRCYGQGVQHPYAQREGGGVRQIVRITLEHTVSPTWSYVRVASSAICFSSCPRALQSPPYVPLAFFSYVETWPADFFSTYTILPTPPPYVEPGLQIFFLHTRFSLSHLPYVVEPGLQILALITLSKILLTGAPYASQPDHPQTSLYTVQAGALGPSPFGSAARRRRYTFAGAPSGTAPPTSPSGLGTEVQWN